MTIRILLADDDPLVLHALRSIIDSAEGLEVIGETRNGEQAAREAVRSKPDVVLMDIRMPVLDGIAATRKIVRLVDKTVKILVVTTFGAEDYVYEALRAGASGFLLKNAPPEQLIDGIRVIASGESLLAPAVTRAVVERYVASPRATGTSPPPALAGLTPRELEVMRHIAQGLTNQEIATALVVSLATVKTHVARILMKLGVRDRAQVVVAAYESGLVEPGRS
jgi:DNA-binding NarL/FixJ family response regulator